MTEKELEEEILRREEEYADLCEFNCFSEKDSNTYLAGIANLEKELRDLRHGII